MTSFLLSRHAWAWGALALGVAGCGGKVIFLGSTSGGGTGGTNTTVGGPATNGATTNAATTNAGTTVAASTGATGGPCSDFTGNGGGCLNENETCPVPLSCCAEHATCMNNTWQATGPFCNSACTPCGPSTFGCALGAICVEDQTETAQGTSYHCAPNPCPSSGLNCSCAGSLCAPNFLSCGAVMGQTVICDCPNCGG